MDRPQKELDKTLLTLLIGKHTEPGHEMEINLFLVRHGFPALGNILSLPQHELVSRLWDFGLRANAISELLGITVNAVYNIRRRF